MLISGSSFPAAQAEGCLCVCPHEVHVGVSSWNRVDMPRGAWCGQREAACTRTKLGSTALGTWFLCATLCREQVLLYGRGLLRRRKISRSRKYLISPPVFSLFVIN